MLSKKSKIIVITVFSVLFIVTACILQINTFLQNPSIRGYLLSKMGIDKYTIQSSRLEVSLSHGLGISAYDLEAQSIEGFEEIKAVRLTMHLDISELLRGNIVFSDTILFQPRIKATIKKGESSSQVIDGSVIGTMIIDVLERFHLASIKEGVVVISGLPFHLHNVNFSVSHNKNDSHRFALELSGEARLEDEHVPFRAKGTIARNVEDREAPFIETMVKTGALPLAWLSDIASLPVKSGFAEAEIQVKGFLSGSVSLEGKITAKAPSFLVVNKAVTKNYDFLPYLTIDFETHYFQKILSIPVFQVKGPDLLLNARTELDFKDSLNPHMIFILEGPFMPLKSFIKIFPTPLVPSWVEKRLFPLLTGGEARLDNFSLKGTFNEIGALNHPENKDVLSLELSWRALTMLKNGPGLPFENVDGTMRIKNGELVISGLKGRFDNSVIDDLLFSLDSLYNKDPLYHFSLKGNFDLHNLKALTHNEFVPKSIRKQLLTFKTFSGKLRANLQINYKETWDYPVIQESEFQLNDCTFVHKDLLLPLRLNNVDIHIDKNYKGQFKGTGKWGKNSLKLSGSGEHIKQKGTNIFKVKSDITIHDILVKLESSLNYKNTSEPSLTLMIKTPFVPIESLKNILPPSVLSEQIKKNILPSFTQGHVQLNHLALKGSIHEIQNLNLSDNKDVLSLEIVWKDVEFQINRQALPFRKFSGRITLSKGDIFMSKLMANWGTSLINKASLSIKNLYSSSPLYKFILDGDLDIANLKELEKFDMIPQNIRLQIGKFLNISGNLKAHVQVDYTNKWHHPKVTKGELRFSNCLIIHEELFFPLSIYKANLIVEKNNKSYFKGTGIWGDSKFNISGLAENLWHSSHITAEAEIAINELVNYFYKGKKLPVQFSRNLPSWFTLSKRNGKWVFNGNIDLKGTIIETDDLSLRPHDSLKKITFSAELNPDEKLVLNHMKLSIGASSLDLSGYYNLENKNFLNLKVAAKSLDFKDLRIWHRKTNTPVKGTIWGHAEINLFPHDHTKTTVTGRLDAEDLSFSLSKLPFPVYDCDLSLRFNKNSIALSFLQFRPGDSSLHRPIEVEGYLRGWKGVQGELVINTNYLDFSDFLSYKDDFSSSSNAPESSTLDPKKFIKNTNIQLYIEVDKGRWRKLEYGPLRAECNYRGGHFFLDHSEIQMGRSLVKLEGHIKTGKEPEMLFSSYIKLTEHPVKEILQSFDFEKYLEVIDVNVNSEGYIYLKGKNKEELIKSLTGSINILMKKGVIHNPYVILNILNILNQNRIRKRNKNLSGKGYYFNSIKGHIVSKDGVLESDNLVMKSPLMNVSLGGKVDMVKELIDSDFEVHPLRKLSSFISKIPVIGHILTGEEKALIIYSFKVKGPLFKPEVKYQPLRNITNIARWYYRRSIDTPERLLKKTSEIEKRLSRQKIPLPHEDVTREH